MRHHHTRDAFTNLASMHMGVCSWTRTLFRQNVICMCIILLLLDYAR